MDPAALRAPHRADPRGARDPELRRRHLDQRESDLPLLREAAGRRAAARPGGGFRGQGLRAVLADRDRALLLMRLAPRLAAALLIALPVLPAAAAPGASPIPVAVLDRKSTRLNSSH